MTHLTPEYVRELELRFIDADNCDGVDDVLDLTDKAANLARAYVALSERVGEFVARHTSTFEGVVVACSSPSIEEWRAFVTAISAGAK